MELTTYINLRGKRINFSRPVNAHESIINNDGNISRYDRIRQTVRTELAKYCISLARGKFIRKVSRIIQKRFVILKARHFTSIENYTPNCASRFNIVERQQSVICNPEQDSKWIGGIKIC